MSMRGRDKFSAVRPLLLTAANVLRLFPTGFSQWLWRAIEGWHGSLGVAVRWVVARRLAKSLGENVYWGPYVEVRGWASMVIGSNVSIHSHCFIDARGGLTVGDDVSVAHQCSVITFEHGWSDVSRPIRDNPVQYKPICIGSDVWVGGGVRILAGTEIGRRVIVAAGAVVTKRVPDGQIVGGVPARQIGSTEAAQ